ncbi:hypothetical protein [Burkholderia gladioli]|uniref:hypothetical protein n=1 Tax=Burkholderia gladioli TaxID=28095 RepID=UPI0016413E90|nr:hypothetical protein [Burkholderia gladioli]
MSDKLSVDQIDAIANDGHRNAAGGIYATSVHAFARAIEHAVLAASPAPAIPTVDPVAAVRALVADDSYAATFQNFRSYRSALLAEIQRIDAARKGEKS